MQPYSCDLDLSAILESPNVAELLDAEAHAYIGRCVVEAFEMDRQSRAQWETKMEKAAKIALQVAEQKTFPWPGASNVKFPLLTIASLQYHSRAYPALVDTPNLVSCLPVGNDPQGQKSAAAFRVSEHMSWQLTEEDEGWEGETDKALLVQAIMGCAFKKTYFDAGLNHNVSECVLPQDFVVSYFTKSLDSCLRATHVLNWSRNLLVEKQRRGFLLETELSSPETVPLPFGQLSELKDQAQGLTMPSQDPEQPYIILEQHHEMDLDGDGYAEPYVSFVRYDTRRLLRILPRFLPSGVERSPEGEVIKITPERFFTKIPFIPSPDGGFYDLGFGTLLGPLNESIDTAINQLFDAGTMHNAGGGFLGKGARVKGGEVTFRPNEWKRVDATGDDLRKSIVELPRREPSAVLFQLLSLLIDFGQRVAGAPDIMQGQNPGQNTPAETSRNMMEQGIKVFSGVYKRTYRALKEEFRKLYRLNELYLDQTKEFISPRSGFEMKVLAEDYRLPASFIRPAADPHYMSDAMRMNQAMAVMQASATNPGYNRYLANRMYLQALRVPNIDQLLPDPRGPNAVPPPVNPKVQLEQMKLQADQLKLKAEQAQFQMEMRLEFLKLMEEHELNRAKILKLEGEAAKAVEEAGGVRVGHAIALLDAQIGAARSAQEGRMRSIEVMKGIIESLAKLDQSSQEGKGSDDQRGMGGMAASAGDGGLPAPGGTTADGASGGLV